MESLRCDNHEIHIAGRDKLDDDINVKKMLKGNKNEEESKDRK